MYREPAPPSRAVELEDLAPRRWWRSGDDALELLGERVIVSPLGYASLDGVRRVRFVAGDADARFEELDPASGVTLRSVRARTHLPRPDAPQRDPRAVWHAQVIGRPRACVCLAGRPPRGEPEPRMVRLLAYDEGVLVVRVASDGRDAGDTWHARGDEALRQLARELGDHVGTLRRGDRLRPWRREDAWSAPSRPGRL